MAKKKRLVELTPKQIRALAYAVGAKDARLVRWLGFSPKFLQTMTIHMGLSRKVKGHPEFNYCDGFNDTLFGKKNN